MPVLPQPEREQRETASQSKRELLPEHVLLILTAAAGILNGLAQQPIENMIPGVGIAIAVSTIMQMRWEHKHKLPPRR